MRGLLAIGIASISLAAIVAVSTAAGPAVQAAPSETVERLIARIQSLEKRVDQLEKQQHKASATSRGQVRGGSEVVAQLSPLSPNDYYATDPSGFSGDPSAFFGVEQHDESSANQFDGCFILPHFYFRQGADDQIKR